MNNFSYFLAGTYYTPTRILLLLLLLLLLLHIKYDNLNSDISAGRNLFSPYINGIYY